MDNFDKILKQKIEQIPFEYDPNDWNGVLQKQKSVSVGFSLMTKILFSVFLLLLISSAVFYSINTSGEQLSVSGSKEIVKKEIEEKKIEKKEIGNTEIDGKEIGNREIVSNEIEEKKIEKKEIGNTEVAGKEIGNKEIVKKEIEEKKIEEREIGNTEVAGKEIGNKEIVKKEIEEKKIEEREIGITEVVGKEIGNKEIVKKEIEEKKIADKEVGKTDNNKGSSSELTVNGVVQNYENSYQQSTYIPEKQVVVLGEARMKSNFSFAVLKKSIENYLSISQIGLERARDIVIHLNNHFLNEASLSGFEGRYTLSSSINVAAITENIDKLNNIPLEFLLANSFPIKSKKMGVGIAFQQIRGTSYNSLLFNVSLAKQFTLNRNNTLLIGGGINTASVDKLDVMGPDYPWTQSPNLLNNENQLISLNLGMRFVHKSIYASLSTSNIYRYAFTKDVDKSISPFTLHFASGGRLRLNEKWSLNPSVNYRFMAHNRSSYATPYLSLSKRNKIYFGVHSENFNSAGAHFGFQAFHKLDCYMRAGYSLNEELRNLYGSIHYTEVGIKLGIGQFQK